MTKAGRRVKLGWLTGQTLANGAATAYGYDVKGEVTDAHTVNASNALLSNFAVPTSGGYDGAGDRWGVTATDVFGGAARLQQGERSLPDATQIG